MIYILVIAALVIINFTNVITRIQSKEYKNKLEIFIIDNYKYLFGLTFYCDKSIDLIISEDMFSML